MAKYLSNIKLYDIHSSGRAIGSMGTGRIYVDGGIPGETTDLESDRRQRGFRYGKIINIVEQSPQRIQPFCQHCGICGGCLWQHYSYEAQLHWKREILLNALRKYEIITPEVPAVTPSPLLQGYRNKSEYAFAAPDNLGFHEIERRDMVCNIEKCFLQPEVVHETAVIIKNAAKEQGLSFYDYFTRQSLLRSLQLRTTTTGQLLVWLVCAVDDVRIIPFLQHLQQLLPKVNAWFYSIDRGEPIHVSGEQYLMERSGDLTFRYSASAFYQPNPLQAENIFHQVRTYAALKGHELVYDLYTGIGTLACHVARDARMVIGVEGNASAIADAQYNASVNNLTNTRFLVGDILHTFKDDFIAAHGRPDVVILDPPRSGTLIEIKKTILRAAPQKIVYVSCNPVSLAFDLKQLCEGYRVAAIQPFDMFPHTHYVETVALLEKIQIL
ncbi:MAG: 23S rRNA (uracil(1939)-C(5))-methyltransferase RlmD [Prevotellaceae bacterium]|jgi:23S rRNA (uracil1939-C5)-methyltransferase|nr:23S rRNA (uracil(1939)-C(5))-methyltransferase RlmD [Prevotellaceae bacterium]